MSAITKRELNQQTAKVLARVSATGAVVQVTERGVPKWQLMPIETAESDRLAELTRQGWVIAPKDDPPPWPDQADTDLPMYSPQEVDELVQWIKDDR
ncbi:MAG: type II toxin-antitoxin system prevent-host-death family antitoxin [Micrococcales bacterium]|nr:type II toxin-antitoxin system prevent-host-death family antitoxin [Micrococcales bacterium]